MVLKDQAVDDYVDFEIVQVPGPRSMQLMKENDRLQVVQIKILFQKLLLVLVDLAGYGLDPLLRGLREVFWKLHCRRRWQLTSRRLHTDLLRSHW